MKKPAHKKKSSPKKHSVSFVRYVVVTLGVLALIFGVRSILAASQTVHVLGVETGPVPVLLADHGSDEGSSSGGSGGDSESSSGGSSSGGTSSEGSGSSDNKSGSNSGSGVTTGSNLVLQDTQVDCVGPDGKHFTTSFHDCQELNQKWGRSNFQFTPLSSPQQSAEGQVKQPEQENTSTATQGELRVKQEGIKSEINVETQGLHIEVKREDDGSVHLTAKKEDGTEIDLQKGSLADINEALQEKEVEVATSASSINNLVLKKGEVEAETKLPIGVDPTTHDLTVTTPAGVKTVTVLPDEAVQNILNSKTLTSIETQVSSVSGAISQRATLTEINSQPVFAINGVSQKNILGLFPVGFAKTAFVSAVDGKTVRVDETLLNRILEALSF